MMMIPRRRNEFDLSGCEKDDIKIEIEDGYLTIHATTESHKEEKKYIPIDD